MRISGFTSRLSVAAGGAAVLLACLAGAQEQPPGGRPVEEVERHRQDLAQQLRNEREQDARTWIAGIRSRCDGSDPLGRARVCVRLLDARPLTKGDRARVAVTWRNLPAEAAFVVELVRDAPPGRRGWLAGALGPIMLAPEPATGSGERILTWPIDRAGCAPADAPTWCPTEIGCYRLRATVYDRRAFAILGWPSRHPPRPIAQSGSPGFRIVGEPDWRPLAQAMAGEAERFLQQRHQSRQRVPVRPIGGVERRSGAYCLDFAPPLPLEGRLTACAPGDILGEAGLRIDPFEISVSGDARLAAGVIGQAEAEARARTIAERPYLARVRFRHQPGMAEAGYPGGQVDFQAWSDAHPLATTYLSDDVMEARYRGEDGGYWLFVLSEIMAGGKDGMPERFADKVLVRVDNRGRACVVETVRYSGASFARDPATDRIACP